MKPTLLDKQKPYSVVRGDAGYAYTQVVDGVRYGFDKDGFVCYDESKDPDVKPAEKPVGILSNVPGRISAKVLDRKRIYSKVRGDGLPYTYMQDGFGYNELGELTWADPEEYGHFPPPGQVVEEEPEEEPEEKRPIYNLVDLRAMTQSRLKELWFHHGLGDWRGTKGKPASLRAIEKLSRLTE